MKLAAAGVEAASVVAVVVVAAIIVTVVKSYKFYGVIKLILNRVKPSSLNLILFALVMPVLSNLKARSHKQPLCVCL